MPKIKSKSWGQYAIHRFGEYLVTAELCRRGFSATPFAGNLPHIDIMAMDEDGSFIPVQVKTIKQNSSWQFDVRNFVDVQFDGNRHIDIMAMDEDGSFIPVQVKTIKQNSSWQFDVRNFADVQFDGNRQILKSPKDPPYPNLICVLVRRGEVYGEDMFFILTWEELRDIIYMKYSDDVARRLGGIRPRTPQSTHYAIYPIDLVEYKDRWELFEKIRTGLHRE